jgi:hypothetical protein
MPPAYTLMVIPSGPAEKLENLDRTSSIMEEVISHKGTTIMSSTWWCQQKLRTKTGSYHFKTNTYIIPFLCLILCLVQCSDSHQYFPTTSLPSSSTTPLSPLLSLNGVVEWRGNEAAFTWYRVVVFCQGRIDKCLTYGATLLGSFFLST